MSEDQLRAALRESDNLLRDTQRLVFHWLEGRDVTERQALDKLVELLDGPRQRNVQEATRVALGDPPLPANDSDAL
jgi:hypothetical protein